MLHDSYEQLASLRVLAERCASEIFLFGEGALGAELDTISAALGRLYRAGLTEALRPGTR